MERQQRLMTVRERERTFHGIISPTTPYGCRKETFKKLAVLRLDSPRMWRAEPAK